MSKTKCFIIKNIYLFLFTSIALRMISYIPFAAANTFKRIDYIFLIVVINLCIIYFLVDVSNYRIKSCTGIIYLFFLICFETFIAVINNSIYFPTILFDIFLWPFIFMVFYNYTRENELPKLIKTTIFLFYMLYAFISSFLIRNYFLGLDNGSGVFSVYYCLTTLPLLLKEIKNKKIQNLSIIICIILLICSNKRGGTIAALTGIFSYYLMFYYVLDNNKQKFKKAFRFFIICLIIIICFYYIIQQFDILIIRKFNKLNEDGGSGRDKIWQLLFSLFNQSTLSDKLCGHGFQSVYYKVMPFGHHRFAHNSFIEYLYDYGIIGLSILIIYISYLVSSFLKMKKKKHKNSPYMIMSIVISIILGMVSYLFEECAIVIPLVILWGSCIGEFDKTKFDIISKKEELK